MCTPKPWQIPFGSRFQTTIIECHGALEPPLLPILLGTTSKQVLYLALVGLDVCNGALEFWNLVLGKAFTTTTVLVSGVFLVQDFNISTWLWRFTSILPGRIMEEQDICLNVFHTSHQMATEGRDSAAQAVRKIRFIPFISLHQESTVGSSSRYHWSLNTIDNTRSFLR